MREILFRGKRIDNGEWVEGYYLNRTDINGNIIESVIVVDAYEQITNGQRYVRSNINRECFHVDYKTVGQFIGLVDKNGKRVFEGDILRFLAYGKVYTGKVEFLNGAFWVKCRFHDRIGSIVHEYKPEIIGNIHDNPELLRGEKE